MFIAFQPQKGLYMNLALPVHVGMSIMSSAVLDDFMTFHLVTFMSHES